MPMEYVTVYLTSHDVTRMVISMWM